MLEQFIKWILQTFSNWHRDDNVVLDISVSERMRKAIDLWNLMYCGNPPWADKTTKTMNLPSVLASELARMATIEMKSELEGSKRAEFMNESYQKLITDIRPVTEFACAMGSICFKPYVADDKIEIDCVKADSFLPVDYDSDGEVCGGAFVSRIIKGDKFYTRIEWHYFADEIYKIKNAVYESNSKEALGNAVPFERVPEWENLEPLTEIKGIKHPLFSCFKMPFANHVDSSSPMGVSVFSRAVNLIEQADRQYSRLLWEFEGGELAIDASIDALRYDKKHQNGRLPKLNERLFRGLDVQNGDKDLYEVFSPALRDQSLINGLNEILIRIEDACGFARGTVSNLDNTAARTATELKNMKQRTYSLVCDTQKALKHALEGLVIAMEELCDLYNLAPSGTVNASFEFDDSVIADRETEFKEKQQLVVAGIMQPWEFRAWYFGETEEEAKGKVQQDDLYGQRSEE